MLEKAPVGEEMSPMLSGTEKQKEKTTEDSDKGRFWRNVKKLIFHSPYIGRALGERSQETAIPCGDWTVTVTALGHPVKDGEQPRTGASSWFFVWSGVLFLTLFQSYHF